MSGAMLGMVGQSSGLHRLPRPDGEALIFRELSLTIRFIRRVRFFGGAVLFVLAILMLAVEDSPTSFAILIGATLVLVVWTILDKTGVDERAPVTRGRLIAALAAGFSIQTVLIVFTGGIESPFLVVYVPLMIMLAIGLGERRVFRIGFLLPLSVIGVLAAGYAAGWLDDLRPSFLSHPAIYTTLSGGVVLGVTLIGGSAGLSARHALNRAIRSAAEARSDAFSLVMERNRELFELSGALAHELKNPLTAIQGLSTVVARKLPADSREAEQMEVVLAEVRRMGSILEEFLNFSRPTQPLGLEEVAPASLIDDVVSLHEAYAERRGIAFYVRIDSDSPVRCDPRKIKQVLVNLVQNALDAAPDDSQITLGVRALADDTLEFTVDDRGPGLASEMQGRLFTPGTTTKAAGSGLGLTIARAISHQHGGQLTLQDRPEGGCRARLTLPLVEVEGLEPSA